MRLTTPEGIVVEGNPDEIAQILGGLGVRIAPPAEHRPAARLTAPPSNEQLYADYVEDPAGMGKPTRKDYHRAVETFEYQIAPRSFLDATVDDVRAFERAALDICALRQVTELAGRGRTGPRRTRCKVGLYDWQLMQPMSCAPTCPFFKRQSDGPNKKLQGLRHFYDWLIERGFPLSNPVAPVQKRHNRTRDVSATSPTYRPTLQEARAIARALVETKTPRDVALWMHLCKTSRRSDHTLNLWADDVHGLLPGDDGPFYFDYTNARERIKKKKDATRTKLKANLVAPGDEELRAYMRDVYMPWRQQQWGYAWNEGPLYPGIQSWRKPFRSDTVGPYVLDPAMRHLRDTAATPEERASWERHLDPMSEERLTQHGARHFATDEWERLGVEGKDIDILRGDVVKGSKGRYFHLTPERVCAKLPFIPILSDEPPRRAAQTQFDA